MSDFRNTEASDKILTAPNVITLVRFLLIPLFLALMFGAKEQVAALVVFAIACSTDWVDGQVARRTGQVSKLGMVFDPFVDRFLLAAGILSVFLLGRVPVWMLLFIITRDVLLLVEAQMLFRLRGQVPRVSYVGKFATAFLMVGFCLLLLGVPEVSGLGLLNINAFPGWGDDPALLGVFFLYPGMVLSIVAWIIYQVRGVKIYKGKQAS